MERELWAELSQAICEVDARWREPARFVHRTALVARVYLWAAVHDRPISWACDADNWDARTRPPALPDQSTLSRRTRRDGPGGFEEFMHALAARLGGRTASLQLVKRFDGKPLAVAAHSTDRDAAWGRGAGGLAKGYKLHTLWCDDRPLPLDWALTPLDVDETRMAARFINRLGRADDPSAGYVLGDARLDSGPLHARAAAANHQLLAPRLKGGAGRGLGHGAACRHPARVRCVEMLEPPAGVNDFGPRLHRTRQQIERDFGNLVSFGGGLAALPAWVRRIWRVRCWVHAKLLINAARIRRLRRGRA
jgi:Transposase DDE domain